MALPDGVTVTRLGKDESGDIHYEWQKDGQAIHLEMQSVEGGYEQAWCDLCKSFDCEHALAVLEFEVPEDSEWRLADTSTNESPIEQADTEGFLDKPTEDTDYEDFMWRNDQ